MTFETLETNRLILRKLTEGVYQHMLNNYNDFEIMELLNIKSSKELVEEKDKIKQGYSCYGKTLLLFQIIDKETCSIIG